MELWLVDKNPELVEAWKQSFAEFEKVHIVEGDILAQAECSLVSPANSYGFMDGGIDRLYVEFFGSVVEQNLQKAISKRPEGYLPIGSAELVRTHHNRIPYVISAPTMVTPEAVPSENCFYAMIAILRIVSHHSDVINKVYCPGLGTGIGNVPPKIAAEEMAMAYRRWQIS